MGTSYTFTRHLYHQHSISIPKHIGLLLWSSPTCCHRSRKPVWKWTVQRPVHYNRLPQAPHSHISPSNQWNDWKSTPHPENTLTRKQSWLDALPIILLGIRNMPNKQSFSPANAITEAHLLLPKPIIDEEYPDLTRDDSKIIARRCKS